MLPVISKTQSTCKRQLFRFLLTLEKYASNLGSIIQPLEYILRLYGAGFVGKLPFMFGLLPEECGLTSFFELSVCLSFVLFVGSKLRHYCRRKLIELPGVTAEEALTLETCKTIFKNFMKPNFSNPTVLMNASPEQKSKLTQRIDRCIKLVDIATRLINIVIHILPYLT